MNPTMALPDEWRATLAAVGALLADVDPVAFAGYISLLPPQHPLACAARTGLDVGEARHVRHVGLPRHRNDTPPTASGWAEWLAEWAQTPRRRLDPHPVAGRLLSCDHLEPLAGVCNDCFNVWSSSRGEMRGAA